MGRSGLYGVGAGFDTREGGARETLQVTLDLFEGGFFFLFLKK